MKNNWSLIFPRLVGKRIQKIEQSSGGNEMKIHTKDFVVSVSCNTHAGLYCEFTERTAAPEPLVIPAKKA